MGAKKTYRRSRGNRKEQTKRRRQRKKDLPMKQGQKYQLIDGNFTYYPAAYCKYYKGWLSVGLIQTHKCQKKGCPMMGEQFELWVKGCEEFHTELKRLEGDGDTAMYVTTTPYELNGHTYYKAPVYHVWIDGKELIATTFMYEAVAIWNKHKERMKDMATKKKAETVAAEQAQEQKEVKRDVKGTIIEALKRTNREGVDILCEYLEQIGFFTAPASGANHSNGEGGLAEHSLNVMFTAEKIGVALYGGQDYNKIHDSVVIAALLHDVGKCGDRGKAMYIPNVLKSGKVSEAKPWKHNKELLDPDDHAVRSLEIINRFVDLTEEERHAIRFHDGLYVTANYGVKGHETPLYLILHMADMWSSRIIEGGTLEGGESDGE